MTAKTIHKRAKSKFNKPKLRRTCKKAIRVRFKKSISLSKVDAVWKDWVEYMIVQPLLKGEKVQLDKHFSLEVVGQRIIDNKKAFNLMSRGYVALSGGGIKKAELNDTTRYGLTYAIEMTETRFKEGKLIFTADQKIRERVSRALKTTNTYYRIK